MAQLRNEMKPTLPAMMLDDFPLTVDTDDPIPESYGDTEVVAWHIRKPGNTNHVAAQDGVQLWNWFHQWYDRADYISTVRDIDHKRMQEHFDKGMHVCVLCGLVGHTQGSCPYRAHLCLIIPKTYTVYPGLVFEATVGWWILTKGGAAIPVRGPLYRRQSDAGKLTAESLPVGGPQRLSCMVSVDEFRKFDNQHLHKLDPTASTYSVTRMSRFMSTREYVAIFTDMATIPKGMTKSKHCQIRPPQTSKAKPQPNKLPEAQRVEKRKTTGANAQGKQARTGEIANPINHHPTLTELRANRTWFNQATTYLPQGRFSSADLAIMKTLSPTEHGYFIYSRVWAILTDEKMTGGAFEGDHSTIELTATHLEDHPRATKKNADDIIAQAYNFLKQNRNRYRDDDNGPTPKSPRHHSPNNNGSDDAQASGVLDETRPSSSQSDVELFQPPRDYNSRKNYHGGSTTGGTGQYMPKRFDNRSMAMKRGGGPSTAGHQSRPGGRTFPNQGAQSSRDSSATSTRGRSSSAASGASTARQRGVSSASSSRANRSGCAMGPPLAGAAPRGKKTRNKPPTKAVVDALQKEAAAAVSSEQVAVVNAAELTGEDLLARARLGGATVTLADYLANDPDYDDAKE